MSGEAVGEFISLHWDDYAPPPYEAIRGHVSDAIAIAELARQGIDWPGEQVPVIEHTWALWAFPSSTCAPGCDKEFLLRGAPGAGRFAVTLVRPAREGSSSE